MVFTPQSKQRPALLLGLVVLDARLTRNAQGGSGGVHRGVASADHDHPPAQLRRLADGNFPKKLHAAENALGVATRLG